MTGFAREALLHWISVGLYVAATAAFANAVLFVQPRRTRWGVLAAGLGLLPHGAAIVLRWISSGHGPYMLRYEVLSSNAFIAVVALLLFLWRRPGWAALALVVLPAAVLMIGTGLFSNPEIRQLPPTLRSTWLVFHISFAKLAAASFLLSTASAVFLLMKERKHRAPWLARLPSAEALDAYVVRFVGFGFLFWTMAVAAGAIWAHQSWGRYWGWDPIETWSLISLLVYGTFLHLRTFFHLKAAAIAWLSIACFAIFTLTAMLLPFLMPSLHSAYFQ
ncbi:MAG TPA: cytochrome c biogenesis protein CcsA [Anaeromyxobacter sp.]